MFAPIDTAKLIIGISGGMGLTASPGQVVAVTRGGGLGVLDLGSGDVSARSALAALVRDTDAQFGVRVRAGCAASVSDLDAIGGDRIVALILTADSPWPLAEASGRYPVFAEVTSLDEALSATADGAAGLILRGSESAGRVSELSSFVLLQQLVADEGVRLPMWVAGGVGPRTAAACVIGGAAGIVLDSQLVLMPESDLGDDLRAEIARMDGTATVTHGSYSGLRRQSPEPGAEPGAEPQLAAIGQDGWLAGVFATRWSDTTAAVRAIHTAIRTVASDDSAATLLTEGSPLARSLGVRLPIVQGPMTRVSDVGGFAGTVSDAGGLPFVALGVAGAAETRRMLTETREVLGTRPWGAGILGFLSEEARTAQLLEVLRARPACAIVAGGRPAQAKALEEAGITAFLHVPSPGLLSQFLKAGARKFVFEGAECGGHVGARSSLPLWEGQLAALEAFLTGQPPDVAGQVQLLFAGGVHDGASAAMVATIAAGVAALGVQVGVLMGTAYLFTEEAVVHGAIQPTYRTKVLAATSTALLETAPGHATRCLTTAFVDDFHALRESLQAHRAQDRLIWQKLEELNTGRLRIASKGKRRNGSALVDVDEQVQAEEGLFMAGQVAVLRQRPTTVAQLHADVSVGAQQWHRARSNAMRRARGTNAAAVDKPSGPLQIAIIGMAGVFPGADDLASFWGNLLAGSDAITEVPPERWDADTYYSAAGTTGRHSASKWGGFLAPVPFDAIGYGIPPTSLNSIDPSQLVALEIATRALRDAEAGTGAAVDHSRTGVVFAASGGSDMGDAREVRSMLPAYLGDVPPEFADRLPAMTADSFPGSLANVIAGRIANRLNLGGPNFVVDAACASSFAALDAACKELLCGSSDLMICGAADLHNSIKDYLLFTSAKALSPTGRCRSFDSAADGTTLGEAVAALVLKRLDDAERDGDRIYAVIDGLGAASDGRALGLTAPRPEGQRRALSRAYAQAGVSPAEVELLEAHGTGTVVGDRTELETATQLFTEAGARTSGCTLGSVKSQIGHTKSAAGLAGLIKATLAVHTGVKPPTINLTSPNTAWDRRSSPFVFHTQPRPWLQRPAARVAAVSAFGFGGTNYHVVLRGHGGSPQPRHTQHVWPAELFCFRGVDAAAAHSAIRGLLGRLPTTGHPTSGGSQLSRLAIAESGRSDPRVGTVQVAVVARDVAELEALLRRALSGEHDPVAGLIQPATPSADGPGKVAFLFPGQGSQRPGALGALLVQFPQLRHYLWLGREVADQLLPPTAFDTDTDCEQRDRLRNTRVAQPVLGIAGLAMNHLLQQLNIQPDMVGGHSYGELVAHCVAGTFAPPALLQLSQDRAQAMVDSVADEPGAMAAVLGTVGQIRAVLAEANLDDSVVLANHNAPDQVVIAGPTAAVRQAVPVLKKAGLSSRVLAVACAFHSPLVAGAVARFSDALRGTAMTPPGIPVYSNRTGEPCPTGVDEIRAELAEQLAAPVRWVEQIEAMYASGARVFVEAGPGRVLGKLVGDILRDRPHLVVSCDADGGDGLQGFLTTVGQLACAGLPVHTGWLYRGREVPTTPRDQAGNRPLWMVDGQLVRDADGRCLPGGLTPQRRIKEFAMPQSEEVPPAQSHPAAPMVTEFLRTTRDLISCQRDVMMALLGVPGSSGVPAHGLTPVDAPAMTGTVTGPVAVPAAARPVAVSAERALVETSSAASDAPQDPPGRTTVKQAIHPVAVPPPVTPPVSGSTPVGRETGAGSEPFAGAAHESPGMDLIATIVDVISQRTGYPVDLIEPELDLEADLSVDSIKRAEIAGELADRLGLPLDDSDEGMEKFVKARTVLAMAAMLRQYQALDATPTSTGPTSTGPVAGVAAAEDPVGVAPTRLLTRSIVAPAGPPTEVNVSGMTCLVTGADGMNAPVLAELQRQLEALGVGVVTAELGAEDDDGSHAEMVVVLDGMVDGDAPLLPDAFAGLRRLLAAAPKRILAVGRQPDRPRTDGFAGLFRTIALEFPQMSARWLQVGTDLSPREVAGLLVTEVTAPGSEPVVRYTAGQRRIEELTAVDLPAVATLGAGPAGDGVAEVRALRLNRDSVVVLVGGARGISTAFARAVAVSAGCRLVLAGRTERSTGPEDHDLASAADAAGLRAAFARRGARPADIEGLSRAVLASREVERTLAELTTLGAEVRYHQLDVRDRAATQQFVKKVAHEYGRLDGLVYAPGVIEDKRLLDKDPASFTRVFSTKVDGAQAVLDTMADENFQPDFVVMFGSVAAVYGNPGQGDYAAANDALRSMGARWAASTGNRCLTVNWGAWAPTDGHQGMVSVELMHHYAKRHIGVIDPAAGATALLRELAWGDPALTSVTYVAP